MSRRVCARLDRKKNFLVFQENTVIAVFGLPIEFLWERRFEFIPTCFDFHADTALLALVSPDNRVIVVSGSMEVDPPSGNLFDRKVGSVSFLTEELLVLVCKKKIVLYSWKNDKIVWEMPTRKNPFFAFALAARFNVFSFPSSNLGEACLRVQSKNENIYVPAHKSEIQALALNEDGSLMATASEKGTVIKVWSINGGCIFRFRRGIGRARIFSLALTHSFLAVSSDKQTIHLFSLDKSLWGVPGASLLSGWLSNPSGIRDYFNSRGSFFRFSSYPFSYVFLCGKSLIVVSSEGEYIEYRPPWEKRENFLFFRERK